MLLNSGLVEKKDTCKMAKQKETSNTSHESMNGMEVEFKEGDQKKREICRVYFAEIKLKVNNKIYWKRIKINSQLKSINYIPKGTLNRKMAKDGLEFK